MRTNLERSAETFGHSVEGTPLRVYLPDGAVELLIVAGVHGEEPETTVTLSRALRQMDDAISLKGVAVVLAMNPDGLVQGTRGNANGVDLNRNFPTTNWQIQPVSVRWHSDDDDSKIPIKTGTAPGSEPEVTAMVSLIERLAPQSILALHAPLACIDDPTFSSLGDWLAEQTRLPLVREIGYPVPGSMGTWAEENGYPIVTWEFPKASVEELSNELGYVDHLRELITASGLVSP